jgi:transposase InsO family protein
MMAKRRTRRQNGTGRSTTSTRAAIAAPARPPGEPPRRQPRHSDERLPSRCRLIRRVRHHSQLLRGPLEFGQYTSFDFTQALVDHDVLGSLGSTGDAYDNAMAESFVDSLRPN